MEDQRRLSEVFVELADTLVTDFDVVDFMTMLADRCVELMGASEAGVLLTDPQLRLHSVASTHETARLLDLFEIQNDEGPCLDCFQTGRSILNHSLLGPDQRWPRFSEEAQRLGFSVVHALPMRLRGEVVGAVNIFSVEKVELAAGQLAVAQALADVATIGLLQERMVREATLLTEQLQLALTSRVVVEQAKGVLAERLQVPMDTAFNLLRQHSQQTNEKLASAARRLLDGDLGAEEIVSV